MMKRGRLWAVTLAVVLVSSGSTVVYAAEDVDTRLKALESQVAALTGQVDDMAKAMELWFTKIDASQSARVEPESFVAGYKRAQAEGCH